MKLACDRSAKRHYRDQETGREYFSVSQALEVLSPNAFAMVREEVLEVACERGVQVHFYFSFLLLWKLGVGEEPEPISPYEGYCLATRKFVDEQVEQVLLVEESDVLDSVGLAGTPDAKVILKRRTRPTLVDLKTPANPNKMHRVQLQTYRKMPQYLDCASLLDVYVRPDGTYRTVPVQPTPTDWAAVMNAAAILHWRASA